MSRCHLLWLARDKQKIDLQEAFKAVSIFFAFDDPLLTGEAHFAVEQQRADTDMRIVLVWASHFALATFFRTFFLDPTLALVVALFSFYVRDRPRVTPRQTGLQVYSNRFSQQLIFTWRSASLFREWNLARSMFSISAYDRRMTNGCCDKK